VSDIKTLYETPNVFLAATLVYLYGKDCLARIKDTQHSETDRRRTTSYSLAVPVDEATIIASDYYADRDSLTILPRAFVGAYNSITQRQKDMRHRDEDEWNSPAWISGLVG
jgi:hypothetical protein